MACGCSALVKAIDAYIEKADENLKDELKGAGYVKPKQTVQDISDLEDEITEALKEETELLTDELEKTVREIFSNAFREVIPRYATEYLNRTDGRLVCERLSKPCIAWMDSWAEGLGQLMKLNSHEEIQAILDKGLKEGVGVDEVGRWIVESGIRDERYKGRRVAVTEILTAHRRAAQEAYAQSPAVSQKRWMHTGAYRNKPRANHVDMDGVTVPTNARFELTGINGEVYYPLYPGDPILPAEERINCKCISQPIVDENILGLSLEERKKLQREAIDALDDEWEQEQDDMARAYVGLDTEE